MRQASIAILLCSLLIVTSHSLATEYQKLSGYVRSLLLSSPQPALSRSLSESPQRSRLLTAFMKVDAGEVDEVCRDYQLRCHARKGDIAIVSIPIDRLSALSHHPAVHRIEASPTAFLTMDTTRVVVKADRLQSLLPTIPNSPYTGAGVVVGVMDAGFDLTHPNFFDSSATRYRIGAFWDQLSKDTVGSPLPVGRDFVGYDNVYAQQHSTDGLIMTHATHTLGIAAGSGYNSPYQGIAPDADICIVNNAINENAALIDSADYYKYTSATDALGFKYIFDYADRQGKPCVISFSEGYYPYFDTEDSLHAAFLDSLSGPGHIIVASAGNEGAKLTYLEKSPQATTAGSFLQSSSTAALYRIKANGPLGIRFFAYPKDSQAEAQTELTFHSSRFHQDSVLIDTLRCCGDTCVLVLNRYPSAFTNDTIYRLMAVAKKSLNTLAFHTAITLEGLGTNAAVYASASGKFANLSIDKQWNDAQSTHNIHVPACFPSVITVGSTGHRFGFANYKGDYQDYSAGRIAGLRSAYSSVGPTIEGSTKPDVMAPGDNIISSYSSYYLEAKPDAKDINSDVEHFSFNGRTYAWNANTGTSMATPVVAGTIALWLQAKPDLTREEIIDVFSHTCRQPDATLTYPNNEYGYGEIDAWSGLLYLLGIDGIHDISSNPTEQPYIYNLHGQHEQPYIYNLHGQRVKYAPRSPSLPKGIYIINGRKYRF